MRQSASSNVDSQLLGAPTAILGLWAISGESQGGMLRLGWEEDEAEDLRGIPGEMP